MKRNRLTVGLGMIAMIAATMPAFAQSKPALQLAKAGVEAKPIRMCQVDGHGQQISPWIYLADGTPRANYIVAYDTFEGDQTGANIYSGKPVDTTYGSSNGAGNSRYYFGTTYENPSVCNDMKVINAPARGKTSGVDKAQVAFWWNPNADELTSGKCFIGVYTDETYGDVDAGPVFSGSYGGFVFDMGVLTNSAVNGGFYYSNLDSSSLGSWTVPGAGDGNGAYRLYYASAYDGVKLTPANAVQPMLWGTRGTNPSQNGPTQWDDDSPADGTWTTVPPGTVAERYDYAYGLDPDPLAAMFALYAQTGSNVKTLLPVSYTVGPQGKEIGTNDVTKIQVNDSIRAAAENTQVANPNIPAVRFNINFLSASLTPSKIAATVIAQTQWSNIEQRLSLVKTDGTTLVRFDTFVFATPGADSTRTNDTTTLGVTPTDFVNGDGSIVAVVQYRRVGVIPGFKFQGRVNLASLDVTG